MELMIRSIWSLIVKVEEWYFLPRVSVTFVQDIVDRIWTWSPFCLAITCSIVNIVIDINMQRAFGVDSLISLAHLFQHIHRVIILLLFSVEAEIEIWRFFFPIVCGLNIISIPTLVSITHILLILFLLLHFLILLFLLLLLILPPCYHHHSITSLVLQ